MVAEGGESSCSPEKRRTGTALPESSGAGVKAYGEGARSWPVTMPRLLEPMSVMMWLRFGRPRGDSFRSTRARDLDLEALRSALSVDALASGIFGDAVLGFSSIKGGVGGPQLSSDDTDLCFASIAVS